MTFEHFPYSNIHNLNLDWIITELKRFEDLFEQIPEEFVLSVNGQTGNVTLYTDANVRFPDLAQGSNWNIFRLLGGVAKGIQFNANGKAELINGTDRTEILTENSTIPYPVTSVNGQTGAVNIDVPVQSVNGETGDVVIDVPVQSVNGKIGSVTTPFTNRSEAILKLDNDSGSISNWGITRGISGNYKIGFDVKKEESGYAMYIVATDPVGETQEIKLLTLADIPSSSGVVSINGMTGVVLLDGNDIFVDSTAEVPETISEAVDEFRDIVGSTPLPTTSQTLTGAIAELDGDIETISDEIGTTELPTTDKTITGAIAELDGDITDLETVVGEVGEDVSDINDEIGNTSLPTIAQTLTGAISENFNSISALQTAIEFFRSASGHSKAVTNVSANTLTTNGIYDLVNCTNVPVTGDAYELFVLSASDSNLIQIAVDRTNPNKGIYYRNKIANNFTDWNKVVNSYDFGMDARSYGVYFFGNTYKTNFFLRYYTNEQHTEYFQILFNLNTKQIELRDNFDGTEKTRATFTGT